MNWRYWLYAFGVWLVLWAGMSMYYIMTGALVAAPTVSQHTLPPPTIKDQVLVTLPPPAATPATPPEPAMPKIEAPKPAPEPAPAPEPTITKQILSAPAATPHKVLAKKLGCSESLVKNVRCQHGRTKHDMSVTDMVRKRLDPMMDSD